MCISTGKIARLSRNLLVGVASAFGSRTSPLCQNCSQALQKKIIDASKRNQPRSQGLQKTFNKLSIDNMDVGGRRVLMRVDFNVPMKDGRILNNSRIGASLATIQYALANHAKSVVVMSHLGRPKGTKNLKYSMEPVALELQKLLRRDVTLLTDCVGTEVETKCHDPPAGSVIMLENLRFHPEEEGKGIDVRGATVKADPLKIKAFRESLAKLGDVYVNDSFATSHRAHSSMLGEGFAKRGAGLLVSKELKHFSEVLEDPPRPFLAILGGSKIYEKMPLIESLLDKVNEMIICGAMAFTFLKVLKHMKIGASPFDEETAKVVKCLVAKAEDVDVPLHLPVDFLYSDKFCFNAPAHKGNIQTGIPDRNFGMDVGTLSRDIFSDAISRSKLIFWNGPPGVFEFPNFSWGTRSLMDAIVRATNCGAVSIIGGTDTAAVCSMMNAERKVTHISTGRNAALKLIQGKTLPGIAALSEA